MQMLSRSEDRRSYNVAFDTVLKYPVSKGSEVKGGDVRHYFLPLVASEFPKLATFAPRSCRRMILSLRPIPQRRDSREHLLHSCSGSSVL